MVFVIDHQGARQVKARVPDAVGVYILPPSLSALEARLRSRNTDSDEVMAGGCTTPGASSHYAGFDYLIVNDSLESALGELHAVVLAERARRWRRAPLAEALLRGR